MGRFPVPPRPTPTPRHSRPNAVRGLGPTATKPKQCLASRCPCGTRPRVVRPDQFDPGRVRTALRHPGHDRHPHLHPGPPPKAELPRQAVRKPWRYPPGAKRPPSGHGRGLGRGRQPHPHGPRCPQHGPSGASPTSGWRRSGTRTACAAWLASSPNQPGCNGNKSETAPAGTGHGRAAMPMARTRPSRSPGPHTPRSGADRGR